MNKIFYCTCLVLCLSLSQYVIQSANAQKMDMSKMHMTLLDKNVYLAMMDTMMLAMDSTVEGSSNSNGFLLQMIPHHQGAISMSNYEIQHGTNFDMIQLAKSIVQEQSNEIQQMQLWLKKSPPENSIVDKEFTQAMRQTMNVMMETMPSNESLKDVDHAFARVMIPHHQAAVDMAKVLLKYSEDKEIVSYAKHLISSEQMEIEQMSSFIK